MINSIIEELQEAEIMYCIMYYVKERAFALKHFVSKRWIARVDVVSWQLMKSVGERRGPSGKEFQITLDRQYDMDNKRMGNLADHTSDSDAVSRRVMQTRGMYLP